MECNPWRYQPYSQDGSLINETYVGVNPAAFGMWYGLQNTEDWRLQLGVIYSVVIDGLGQQLVDQISFGIM